MTHYYDAYLGAIVCIFLLNVVQWSFSRDWIYGLFNIQTFVWLVFAISFNFDLELALGVTVHTITNTIVLVSFFELIIRLFELNRSHPKLVTAIRRIQVILTVRMIIETSLLLTVPSLWQQSAIYPFVSLFYCYILLFGCGVGVWAGAKSNNAVGYFFIAGSLLFFWNEFQMLLYFTRVVFGLPIPPHPEDDDLVTKLIFMGYILRLLSLSMCLLFHQKQLEIAKAVEQARIAEHLIQEKLTGEIRLKELEREKTDVQLRALQAQVNPHFLFNSLNTLSSLIDESPERAEQFVLELSVVYRYLLRANEQLLTTLASELEFIQSYYHLLKTRHGKGFNLIISVDDHEKSKLIPPLTLQLLVENAVKHNITSPKHPLEIEITTLETGKLTVKNNLQRKNSHFISNKIGLTNIAVQYQSLRQQAPVITDDGVYFSVTLPLLSPTEVSVKI